ncbi:MAG: hypothetical protein K4571_15125, partial [Deltaproteobacteria bacterium]
DFLPSGYPLLFWVYWRIPLYNRSPRWFIHFFDNGVQDSGINFLLRDTDETLASYAFRRYGSQGDGSLFRTINDVYDVYLAILQVQGEPKSAIHYKLFLFLHCFHEIV